MRHRRRRQRQWSEAAALDPRRFLNPLAIRSFSPPCFPGAAWWRCFHPAITSACSAGGPAIDIAHTRLQRMIPHKEHGFTGSAPDD